MKALDEYFPMVVFTLLLNRVHVFANFMFNLNREITAVKVLSQIRFQGELLLLQFRFPLLSFSSFLFLFVPFLPFVLRESGVSPCNFLLQSLYWDPPSHRAQTQPQASAETPYGPRDHSCQRHTCRQYHVIVSQCIVCIMSCSYTF